MSCRPKWSIQSSHINMIPFEMMKPVCPQSLWLSKELHAFICFYITLLFVSSQRVFLPFTPRELRLSAAVNLNGTSRPSRSLESHPHTCGPVFFLLSRLSARICVFCLPIGYFTETHWWVEIDELQYCFKGVLQHSASLLYLLSCYIPPLFILLCWLHIILSFFEPGNFILLNNQIASAQMTALSGNNAVVARHLDMQFGSCGGQHAYGECRRVHVLGCVCMLWSRN